MSESSVHKEMTMISGEKLELMHALTRTHKRVVTSNVSCVLPEHVDSRPMLRGLFSWLFLWNK
jgi:hypothetical protein